MDVVNDFHTEGYVHIPSLLSSQEVESLNEHMSAALEDTRNRYDLGSQTTRTVEDVENIIQIMWPTDLVPGLSSHPVHTRLLALVKDIYGTDLEFDFDMIISKAPFTNVSTPAHQDAAYWPKLPDKRAVSCWVPLDDATVDNGAMWYGPGSHKLPLRPHERSGKESSSALQCDATESEMVCVEAKSGDVILHDGHTLHYSRGNNTSRWRRAYILNFRAKSMIDLERSQGFDHGRTGFKQHEVRGA